MTLPIDPKSKRKAAEIIRAEIPKLKAQARKADAMTAPMLWIQARDLEKLAQLLEDDGS